MQMWGAQGDLHHFLEANKSSEVVRVIHSPRKFGVFRESYDNYFKTSGLDPPRIVTADNHDTIGVVSRLRGYGPQPKPTSLDELLNDRRGGGKKRRAVNMEHHDDGQTNIGAQPAAKRSGGWVGGLGCWAAVLLG